MKIISVGDLVTDFYYESGKLIGLDGGMTSHNIIVNLSKLKHSTKVIAVRGNDSAGELAEESLKNLNVDVSDIKLVDQITRCFHISFTKTKNKYTFTSKKRCPLCSEKKWYTESQISIDEAVKNINEKDIIVFDNLNNINTEIIKSLKHNKIMLDLGQYFEFENLSDQELLDKLNYNYTIIQLNNRVSNYLLKRYNINENELFTIINSKLIVITKGEKGSDFYCAEKLVNVRPSKIIEEIDPTGAGDIHFAIVIDAFIQNDYLIDSNMFLTIQKNIDIIIPKVVTSFGARGHLNELYKVKKVKDTCTCNDFKMISRKQIKRINININSLEKRTLNALKNDNIIKLEKLANNIKDSSVFLGSGGSFAGANFASKVINYLTGCSSIVMYPRDFLYRNNEKLKHLFLFSYSGTTADLITASKQIDKEKVYLITKGQNSKILEKTDYIDSNIFSYYNGLCIGSERGFLAFEGALAPASMFLYLILKEETENFIKNSFKYWNIYFEKYFKDNKNNLNKILKPNNVINTFTGDHTSSASIDFESKIIESGVYNIIVHEKKNFSHGRFINLENQRSDSYIYFKTKDTTKYEEKLLEYLEGEKLIVIESKYEGILSEYDLLVASQYLTYYISKLTDIDLSKPDYSEDSMKLYFHKGEL